MSTRQLNWYDFTRAFSGMHHLSDDEAGALLWNETGYPAFGTIEDFREQLRDWRRNQ